MSGRKTARTSGRKVRFPERANLALPAGTLARIERAAADRGEAPTEWLRGVIRRALDAARKVRERKAVAK